MLSFIEQNINQKKKIVEHALNIFVGQVCNMNRDLYTNLMVNQKGYVTFCKKFYENSGKLTTDEIQNLYEKDIIPSFICESISETESKIFGIALINYC
jgi:hypothetical protein